jgi:beta-glucosidase
MHELYLWPFADGVHAGTANIMCSYNRVNNSHSCANSKVLNGLLKTELGFQGFVVTDWFAQHTGTAAALAGLDMAMPDGQAFWGPNFTEAFLNGSVPESRLDDMATRIIASWYKVGQDSPDYPAPGIGMPANLSEPHTIVDARDPTSRSTVYEGAIEGHVLVKNENAVLPLKSPKLLAVFGYDAPAPPQYMPDGDSLLTNPFTIGFESAFNQLSLAFSSSKIDWPSQLQIASNGTYSVGSGSGANSGPYISAPLDALQQRAMKDGSVVYWDTVLQPGLAGLYEAADACLVFINAFASEGMDRPGLHDDYSDNIVQTVASTCNNTIVVIHNAGVRLVDQWIDHPNVTALIFAHLPGQDSGNSLVDLLYGDAVPSGKLPYSVPKNESDFANMLRHSYAVVPYAYFPQSDFTEGVYIDYRAFDPVRIRFRPILHHLFILQTLHLKSQRRTHRRLPYRSNPGRRTY